MYRDRTWKQLATAALVCAALGPAFGPRAAAAPADDQYADAAALYAANQWEESAAAFGRFLDLHADHERADAARLFHGESLAQIGKYEMAAKAHEEFLRRAPQHPQAKVARFRAGECLLLAGQNDLAKGKLVEFRRDYPVDELNAFVLPYLGEIALSAENMAEAESYYEQSLRDYPRGPLAAESRFGLARCKQQSGKAAEAIALYEQVAADHEHALADDARLQIGLAQHEARQFAAAEESLLAFRTTFAESELAPQAWYWLGLSQQAAGRPADAAATLASAAKQYAESREAAALHAAAGDAFRHGGDTAQADWHFQRLIAQWPQSEWADDALISRAELAMEAGEPERAAALAAELARRFPESPHAGLAAVIRAHGLIAAEKFAAAEELLLPIAENNGEQVAAAGATEADATVSDHQAAYLLALARIGQKKYEAALAALEPIGDLPADDALADSVGDARCSALLGLERYTEAARLLRSRLESLPAHSERADALRGQLAVALARSGNLTDAISQIELLQATATSDPDVAAAVLLAAEKAYDGRQLLVAQRLFSLVSAEHVPAAERSQALSGLAWTQFRLAGKQASAGTFERLLRDYPDSPLAAEAALLRARSLEDTQQDDAALATYRLVIDKYSDSPLVPQALWGAARLHEKLDQDREAAALLTKLVGEFPKFAQRDAALFQLGWVQSDLQDLPAAEAAHAALIKEYPDSQYWADGAYRLAELAARRKETTKAIELADQVLTAPATEGVRENALYLRGQLAAAEGKWDDVARYMGEHTKQFPASTMNLSARYWQAEAAFRKGDYDAASKQLTQLEIAGQSRREAWLGIVPLRRAQCLAQQKHWTEALRLAESVAKRYPQFAQLYEADYLIGRALGSLARFDEARAAYDRVLQSPAAKGTETAAMAQWMIGETYFHQKRYADATAAYERCLEQHAYPRWQAAALLQAGKCRLLMGDYEAARQDLERVASEFADQPLAAEARSRLESLRASPPAAASLAEKSR